MTKHGLVSPYREKRAAKGGLERERLEEMIGAGMTIAEIAAEVGRSKAAVRHWMRAYRLRTKHERGSRYGTARRAARDAGLLVATLNCRKHGERRRSAS
jgi:transposase